MPEFVDPQKVLEQVGLRPDMTAADFGSGSGGWVIPLAHKLEDGLVYAVDIQETALSALSSKARLAGINNIKKIEADIEREVIAIAPSSCDLVLMTDLLFQVEDKKAAFLEAMRVLKKGGKLLIVEWSLTSPLGPRTGKPSPEELKQIAKAAGFNSIKEFKAGDYHFALLFAK